MGLLRSFFKNDDRNAKLFIDLKKYLAQRYDLLKLELLEKSSRILTVIMSMIVVVVCVLGALIYLSFALIGWLNKLLHSPEVGYLIIAGLFIVIMILVIIYKDRLFLNPLIKKMSNILFDDKDVDNNNIASDDWKSKVKDDDMKGDNDGKK